MINIMSAKAQLGQFYTVRADEIMSGLPLPPSSAKVIEPFAGTGCLVDWLRKNGHSGPIEALDIDPKRDDIAQQDTLLAPPNYHDKWVVSNPPYLARNKCVDKTLYDLYQTNDLYKCAIISMVNGNCAGGILIVPAALFTSVDNTCRDALLQHYHIPIVRFFEMQVFPDTPTTVVAFYFSRSNVPLTEQHINWHRLPKNDQRIITHQQAYKWIAGGEINHLPVGDVKVLRFIKNEGVPEGSRLTHLHLQALDNGRKNRIQLTYKPKDPPYPGIMSSRSFATLCLRGLKAPLTEEQERQLASEFNQLLNGYREKNWSMFLPNFRESKEHARRRIPFRMAYRIVSHILHCWDTSTEPLYSTSGVPDVDVV